MSAVVELQTPAERIKALELLQYHEQQRALVWLGQLRDALVVDDADYRMIQNAFDSVATIVNKISDIGAEMAKLRKAFPQKRRPFFEVAKEICAPARFPDVDLSPITSGIDRAIAIAKEP